MLVLGGCAVLTDSGITGGVAVKELRCEYRVNPLGIDVVNPRLSWIMESNQRGQMQRAYQILVADSREQLKQNKGGLWDSGKVESEKSNQVVYKGQTLKSRMRCYWKMRVYYQTYEVTDLIKKGGNAMGAILADGWYAGYLGFGQKREHYGSEPRLLVQFEIEYDNGHIHTVVTDGTWRASYWPLFESDFLMGEFYDARKEMPGWDTSNFDDSAWHTVAVTEKGEGKVQSYPGVTVQKILEIKPKKLTEPEDGVYVFDMGQNFSGWVRLKVKGKAGTKVVLRFAEMLNPDGTICTENLRAARCTDTYILKGADKEIWEPRFTFHGFRYAEITGYPGKPGLDAITGVVVHSATPLVGSFECSNPMVNQLYSNIVWSQRGNFIEIPTDCPLVAYGER